MKLAFSRPTSTDEEEQSLVENFRSAGFDGLQLKSDQYWRYLDNPAAFKARWDRYPGAASALIVSGRIDDDGAGMLRKVFRFAGAVGSSLVIFCHGVSRGNLTFGDIRRYARELSVLGKDAQDLGTRLSLHHHFDQPVMRRADFDAFFDSVVFGTVGLTIDTAHLAKSGIADIAEVVRSFRNVIDNFHIKDFGEGNWRVLGEGTIDFSPVFDAIREIGYDGWVCADEESGAEIGKSMNQCGKFLREGLGR